MTIREELDSLDLPSRAGNYEIAEARGQAIAAERRRELLDPDARVFISKMGEDPRRAVGDALEKVGLLELVSDGTLVAIKVNIGGGVTGVPSSFSDVTVVEGVADAVRDAGGRPFVCEANMRSMTMHHRLLSHRGYYPMFVRKGVEFVNLSDLETIDFVPLGWDTGISLPKALLHPDVKIISVPSLKHHWECGVTLAQKNMYGAIAERQKSLFHRGGSIDETVAAAARAVTPDISLLAHRQVGGGLGPHFCVPVDFGYIIASDNMMAADSIGCDVMGTGERDVKHLQVNSDGREIPYRLVEGSIEVDDETRRRIAKTALSPLEVKAWRAALYPQYFVPHRTQYTQIPRLEPLGTWANWLFFHPRGDSW